MRTPWFLSLAVVFLGSGTAVGETARQEKVDPSDGVMPRIRTNFEAADRDRDGFVDQAEAAAADWNLERFGRVDRDGDGRISHSEAAALRRRMARRSKAPAAASDKAEVSPATQTALRRRADRERVIFQQLLAEHGENISRAEWLAEHHAVAKKLADNRYFLQRHPNAFEALKKRGKFMANHPGIALRVKTHQNWIRKHPKVAKKVYDHRRFASDHPRASKKIAKHRASKRSQEQASKVAHRPVRDKRATRRQAAVRERR